MVLGIQSSNDRLDEIWTKTMLIEEIGQHCSVSLWMHCTILSDLIQIFAEFQSFRDCDDISLKTSQSEEKMLSYLEYFFKVGSNGLRLKNRFPNEETIPLAKFVVYTHLNSETMISRDCYTVFARHCDDAATIISHNRHPGRVICIYSRLKVDKR